jgi:pachytene checkpoint protein 2
VHRATDALLAGIDAVAAELPRVLFVATTNFLDAVDEAFLSRADLVLELALPETATIARIIGHSLQELAAIWPGIVSLADDEGLHAKLAAACAGWDGRRVRKLVLSALTVRQEVTRDPNLLTVDDLLDAVSHTTQE